ncbi:hypothetical protein E2C01_073138 [Portunus trituberculatus]|uniref:Uncharacterized protein n=1 Tax=Portunus trituberculatus TaxID=210409 RepID=A0A5B7I931_PORTR|nr:hypothetical protein [Portunus trituberculatus]
MKRINREGRKGGRNRVREKQGEYHKAKPPLADNAAVLSICRTIKHRLMCLVKRRGGIRGEEWMAGLRHGEACGKKKRETEREREKERK